MLKVLESFLGRGNQESGKGGLNKKQQAELDWWVSTHNTRPHTRLWATKCVFELAGPILGLAELDDWYAFLTNKTMLDLCCGPEPWEPEVKPAALIYYDWLVEGYDQYDMLTPMPGRVYVTGPAEKMPFAKDSFDFVHFENALDHVDDPQRAVSELRRVVRCGGYVYLGIDIGGVASECEPHVFERCDLDVLFDDFELLGEQEGLPDKPAYNPIDKRSCVRRLYRVPS